MKTNLLSGENLPPHTEPGGKHSHSTLVKSAAAVLLLLLAAAVFCGAGAAASDSYVDGHLLVCYEPGYFPAEGDIITDFSEAVPGLYLIRTQMSVPEAVSYYSSLSYIRYAEPDYCVSLNAASTTPNDPGYSPGIEIDETLRNLWNMTCANAEGAWDITTGSDKVIVAVVDTGINYNHEDLKDNMWTDEYGNYGHNYVPGAADPSDPRDDQGHGTHCAGTIGAVGNNGIGVVGMAWNVSLMAVKVIDAEGQGQISAIIQGILYAAENGANVISMSLGGDEVSLAQTEAIRSVSDRAVVVVAAGNEGVDNDEMYKTPANIISENLISVAAIDKDNRLSYFSNYGYHNVDVAAPGVDILSARYDKDNEYCLMDGTSMATPLVAGIAALMYSADENLKPFEIVGIIKKTVEKITSLEGKTASGGKVNAETAVSAVKNKQFRDVIFDSAGGSEVFPDIALTGGTVDEPAEPIKSGNTFDGWYTSAEGGEEWNFESSTVAENMTLYAHWTKKETAQHYPGHDSVETAWDKTDSLPTKSGNYYLTNDVYLTETWNVNSDITLCLNGQTISGKTELLIDVDTNGNLTLYDCTGYGTISGYVINHEFPLHNDEPVLLMAANSAVPEETPSQPKLLTSTPSEPTYTQGTYTQGVSVKGTFTLKGGTLTDFSAPSHGGAVYVDGGRFIMDGGTITKSLAESGGGVGVVSSGTFTMKDGTIFNCAARFGGGVYVKDGTVAMAGGKIANCTAAQGGGVCADSGAKLTVSESAKITGCTASQGGGGLALCGSEGEMAAAECTMSGGKITGCIVEGSGAIEIGGGVYVDGGVTFTMEDTAEITDCRVYSLNAAEEIHSGGIYGAEKSAIILRGNAKVSNCSRVYYKYQELIEEIPDGIQTSGNIEVYDSASIDYLECSVMNGIKTNTAFSGSVNHISLQLVDTKDNNRVQSLTALPVLVVDGGDAAAVIDHFTLVDSKAKAFRLEADGGKVYLKTSGTYPSETFGEVIAESGGKTTIKVNNNTKILSNGGPTIQLFRKDAPVSSSMKMLSHLLNFPDIYMGVEFSENIPVDTKNPYVVSGSVTGTVVSSSFSYPYLLLDRPEGTGSVFVVPEITLQNISAVSPAFCTTYDETAAEKIREFDSSAEPEGVLSGSAEGVEPPIRKVRLCYYTSSDVIIPENKIAAVYQIDSVGSVTPLNLEKGGAMGDFEKGAYNTETDTLSTYVFAFVTPVTLTYDVNGASSGSAPDVSRLPSHLNVTAAEKPDDLRRAGYTFTGWNTKADGSGTAYAAGSCFIIERDTTLYAQWTVNKTEKNADEGTAVFGDGNITAVKKDGRSKVSSVCLERVSGVTGTVTFTADLVVDESDIPAQTGMKRIVVSVFDIEASPAPGTKASFKVTIELADINDKNNVVFWHCKDGVWEKLSSSIADEKIDENNKITYEIETDSFSPFAITIESAIPHSSSSRNYGTSVWLPATAEPTPAPLYSSEKIIIKIDESGISVSDLPKEYEYTSLGGLGLYSAAIPAGKSVDEAIRFFSGLDGVLYAEPDGYVHIESPVSDAEPAQTGASPAPVMGVIAGLGAAAVLVAVRMRR